MTFILERQAVGGTTLAVPYVALGLQMQTINTEVLAAIARVLAHGIYILGPEVADFERRFAEYCGTRYAVGTSDGTAALMLTLRGLGVGPGDEVITAPNSFIASASSAALLGARPVFVDVSEAEMTLDPLLLERAITPRTKAIVPVHLAGYAADMDPILAIASSRGIPVIEDASQSVGSLYKGRRTGSMGAAGCFSLHPLKNLHAVGDAGIITTNDERLYRWLLKARNHGMRTRDEVEFWSTNSRLDTLHAAILTVSLSHLARWTAERRTVALEYSQGLKDVVDVPVERADYVHTYQSYMIKAHDRDALVEHLEALGIDAKVHYRRPIHMQPAARELGLNPDDFPVTRSLAQRIVSLPIYGELTPEQIQTVIAGVRSFYAASRTLAA
jgi:dTDP-4-amino-4,6-dideoxygalactose transaminase